MDEAVQWLREQIQARLTTAQKATDGPWRTAGMGIIGHSRPYSGDDTVLVVKHTWPQEAAHIVANDPQDAIARSEVELAIIDVHDRREHRCPLPVLPSTQGQLWTPEEGPCWTLCLLASGYRHRDGYADHWRESPKVIGRTGQT